MSKKEILLIVIIVVLAVGFWYSRGLQHSFDNAVSAVEAYITEHQILGIGAFTGLAALSAMLSPFSSVPLVPFAVAIWGKALTLLFLLSGWLLGGALTYVIGRYAFYALLGHLIPFEKIEAYRKKIPPDSEFLIVVFFRVISPADLPGYVLGSVRYNFGKYMLATLIAETFLAVVTVFASQAFIAQNPVELILWVLGATALVISAIYLFRKETK